MNNFLVCHLPFDLILGIFDVQNLKNLCQQIHGYSLVFFHSGSYSNCFKKLGPTLKNSCFLKIIFVKENCSLKMSTSAI